MVVTVPTAEHDDMSLNARIVVSEQGPPTRGVTGEGGHTLDINGGFVGSASMFHSCGMNLAYSASFRTLCPRNSGTHSLIVDRTRWREQGLLRTAE